MSAINEHYRHAVLYASRYSLPVAFGGYYFCSALSANRSNWLLAAPVDSYDRPAPRSWTALHGGVYVPVKDEMQPAPWESKRWNTFSKVLPETIEINAAAARSAFYRAFVEWTGMAPVHYRRQWMRKYIDSPQDKA